MSISSNNETPRGLYFGMAATMLWGSYPLWYKPIGYINAWQLLSWRIVFAEAFLFLLLFATLRYKQIGNVIRQVSFLNIGIMSLILGLWWFLYIYGILTDRVTEVAMGYFISPLMSMVVSSYIFKEKMNVLQNCAVGLASLGVIIMGSNSLSWNSLPWIALLIGFCFSFYGIFKKKIQGDPLITQTLEILMLLPFAAAFLGWAHYHQQLNLAFDNSGTLSLLVATGIITVLPLWWYSLAAKLLPLKTLSFLQFIPPTCNFLLGVFVYQESFPEYKWMSFMLIWIGIVVFMLNGVLKTNRNLSNKNKFKLDVKNV